MSTPGSNRNKTPFDTSRRKQSTGPTVDFTLNTSAFSPDAHRQAAQYQKNYSAFPPQNYDLGARPTGPLDIRMGDFGLLPAPRSPSRQHNSQPPAPGPYDGPGHVSPSPRHMMTPRMDDFPKDFGGRAAHVCWICRPSSELSPIQAPVWLSDCTLSTVNDPYAGSPALSNQTRRASGEQNHHSPPLHNKVLGRDHMRIRDTLPIVVDIRASLMSNGCDWARSSFSRGICMRSVPYTLRTLHSMRLDFHCTSISIP
ncbi:hypothetical protein B0H16DRAFT_1875836, partial [Mycena metata]